MSQRSTSSGSLGSFELVELPHESPPHRRAEKRQQSLPLCQSAQPHLEFTALVLGKIVLFAPYLPELAQLTSSAVLLHGYLRAENFRSLTGSIASSVRRLIAPVVWREVSSRLDCVHL